MHAGRVILDMATVMAEASIQSNDRQTVKGCWAASLGDCEGKISWEHLVSESLLPEGGIMVRGLHWCKMRRNL